MRRSVCHAPDVSPFLHSDCRERDQYTPRPHASAALIDAVDEYTMPSAAPSASRTRVGKRPSERSVRRQAATHGPRSSASRPKRGARISAPAGISGGSGGGSAELDMSDRLAISIAWMVYE